MFDYEIIEGENEVSNEEYFAEIQKAINSGYAWKFQGIYGRTMMDALKSGYCLLGRERASDYYGNIIPSRNDIQEGSFGSYEFVADAMGSDYADLMASI